jgi:hypothetical protein
LEEWKIGKMEEWKNSTPDCYRGDNWKNGNMDEWKFGSLGVYRFTGNCCLATANWLLATGYWQRTPYASRLATANCQLATGDFSLRFANKL